MFRGGGALDIYVFILVLDLDYVSENFQMLGNEYGKSAKRELTGRNRNISRENVQKMK